MSSADSRPNAGRREGQLVVSRGAARAFLLAAVMVLAGAVAWRLGIVEAIFPGEAPLRVQVIGHSWWWEFDYPELGFKTAHELHVPEARRVELELTSVDVLHTLSIPELGVLADALPGQVTQVQVAGAKLGEYGGVCSEICGLAHNMMRAKVVVQAEEDFDAWVASQKTPAALPQSEAQWRGYRDADDRVRQVPFTGSGRSADRPVGAEPGTPDVEVGVCGCDL